MLKVSGGIANETIKNRLLYDAAKFGITYTENLEDFYAAFMKGSTDAKNNEDITKSYQALKALAKGNPSPKFVNYENNAGGTASLDDLKGKYVYIDVWATWCPPCLAEIPSLQKLEKDYHDKNIQFVSISVDKRDDYFTWTDMIEEKNLGGLQLYANEDKTFSEAYRISSIPRFILVDPEGNLVSADAPRPSDPKLVELFSSLGI